MKLGISGQALSSIMGLEEIVTLFKELNVSNMEIWPENIPFLDGKSGYSNSYIHKDIEKAQDILTKNQLTAACVTFSGAFTKDFVEDYSLYSEALCETIRVAKRLGAGIVNHYCFHICMEEKPDAGKLHRYFAPALQVAESCGIVMVLENEAHDCTAKAENMLEIMESFDSPHFKTNFDATNYYHASTEGFPYSYEVLKKHIAYVHIKNGCLFHDKIASYSAESKGSPMGGYWKEQTIYYPELPDGAVNIDGLLRRLKRDKYEGYCVLEPHTAPGLVKDYYESELKYIQENKYFENL